MDFGIVIYSGQSYRLIFYPPSFFMDLRHVLNPAPPPILVDISSHVQSLAALLASGDPLLASPRVDAALRDILASFSRPAVAQPPTGHPRPTRSPSPPITEHPLASAVEYDVKITSKTTLSTLYTYPSGTCVEYPETSPEGVGHLFQLENTEEGWQTPTLNFAYSLGAPKGTSRRGLEVHVSVLKDRHGSTVPCRVKQTTCQGTKICPQVDRALMTQPHHEATRDMLKERLRNDREARIQTASPSRQIFQKTAALVAALRRLGCGATLQEETIVESDEEEEYDKLILHRTEHRRGYVPPTETCQGRLQLAYANQKPYIKCEHYSKQNNKEHYQNTAISDGSYDLKYIEALFSNDDDEVDLIEEAAFGLGFGPLSECTTVCNVSSQATLCPFDHRNADGALVQLEMESLACACKIKVYEPLPEYRDECPSVLVVVRGTHHHPIPFPTKTPPSIKEEILRLLPRFQEDLPDLTPRRFLRHPITKSYLSEKFPKEWNPTLSDLHISLANRSHLKAFIDQVRKGLFSCGTGWKGVLHLWGQQSITRPLKDQYIRRVIDLDCSAFPSHPEDESGKSAGPMHLQFVICMGREGSERLLQTPYLQSDIRFKRVIGFYEFELAGWDRDAHTTVVFCRIFLNRQTAVAHQKIFEAIDQIVFEDTGTYIQWRHIHGAQVDDYDGKILQWGADQHGGQAKGLGLYLQALAQKFPDKMDLHEPGRLLASLTPYEHLHRLFRLCVAHIYRNIQKCKVDYPVKQLMRSLVCMSHENWDGTIARIRELGGKAGRDWVHDKERSHFAFEGMCWAKSFIPEDVWKAGERTSNLIESAHSDINREGVHCTLLGGIMKGQFYDALQMKTLKIFEEAGIRPSYRRGHPTENAIKNIKRQFNSYRKGLEAADKKIWDANLKIQQVYDKLTEAKDQVQASARHVFAGPTAGAVHHARLAALERSQDKLRRQKTMYQQEVEAAKALVAGMMGSGQVALVYSSGDLQE
ncbi:hypothetical protein B0H11DRAFT_2191580 [Mycena galericulata]|nr:hypothetical protein B0H11DRAFT_2191580 [Mycena galericulata]